MVLAPESAGMLIPFLPFLVRNEDQSKGHSTPSTPGRRSFRGNTSPPVKLPKARNCAPIPLMPAHNSEPYLRVPPILVPSASNATTLVPEASMNSLPASQSQPNFGNVNVRGHHSRRNSVLEFLGISTPTQSEAQSRHGRQVSQASSGKSGSQSSSGSSVRSWFSRKSTRTTKLKGVDHQQRGPRVSRSLAQDVRKLVQDLYTWEAGINHKNKKSRSRREESPSSIYTGRSVDSESVEDADHHGSTSYTNYSDICEDGDIEIQSAVAVEIPPRSSSLQYRASLFQEACSGPTTPTTPIAPTKTQLYTLPYDELPESSSAAAARANNESPSVSAEQKLRHRRSRFAWKDGRLSVVMENANEISRYSGESLATVQPKEPGEWSRQMRARKARMEEERKENEKREESTNNEDTKRGSRRNSSISSLEDIWE